SVPSSWRPHFSQVLFISNGIVTFPSLPRLFFSLSCHSGVAPSVSASMHTGNSIIIQAPVMMIFETAANLELWPTFLPHYRNIRYLERSDDRNVVVMAAIRSGIPVSWTSEQIIDRNNFEVRFHHLKAWTKGMQVVW